MVFILQHIGRKVVTDLRDAFVRLAFYAHETHPALIKENRNPLNLGDHLESVKWNLGKSLESLENLENLES